VAAVDLGRLAQPHHNGSTQVLATSNRWSDKVETDIGHFRPHGAVAGIIGLLSLTDLTLPVLLLTRYAAQLPAWSLDSWAASPSRRNLDAATGMWQIACRHDPVTSAHCRSSLFQQQAPDMASFDSASRLRQLLPTAQPHRARQQHRSRAASMHVAARRSLLRGPTSVVRGAIDAAPQDVMARRDAAAWRCLAWPCCETPTNRFGLLKRASITSNTTRYLIYIYHE
jgi:hypothetical protein